MEFQPTGKHLAGGAMLGLAVCFFVIYLGTANPGRYFYEGPYNTHDADFARNNPHSHVKIDYTTACSECHQVGWQTADDKTTCNTSGCHNSIDPAKRDRPNKYGVQFNPVSYNYHELVKDMSCGSCHKIHSFREVEATRYYGEKFDHALMAPDWGANYGCGACHDQKFETLGEIAQVLRTVPEFAEKPYAEVEAASEKWLGEGAKRRRSLGGSGEGAQWAGVPEFDPFSPEGLAAYAKRGDVLLYFRNKASLEPGGACRYLEEEVLGLAPVAAAINAHAKAMAVDWEDNAGAWRDLKMFRAGSFARISGDGTIKRLHFFHSPAELLEFLGGAPSAKEASEEE